MCLHFKIWQIYAKQAGSPAVKSWKTADRIERERGKEVSYCFSGDFKWKIWKKNNGSLPHKLHNRQHQKHFKETLHPFCMLQKQKQRTARGATETEPGYLTSHRSHGSQLTGGWVSRGHWILNRWVISSDKGWFPWVPPTANTHLTLLVSKMRAVALSQNSLPAVLSKYFKILSSQVQNCNTSSAIVCHLLYYCSCFAVTRIPLLYNIIQYNI